MQQITAYKNKKDVCFNQTQKNTYKLESVSLNFVLEVLSLQLNFFFNLLLVLSLLAFKGLYQSFNYYDYDIKYIVFYLYLDKTVRIYAPVLYIFTKTNFEDKAGNEFLCKQKSNLIFCLKKSLV